jgi:hypothetical protein
VLSRVHWVRPELVAEVKYLSWTDDNLLRQVVYEGLREEAGGRGSPAGAALTTLTASLNDQIGPTIVRRDSVFDNRPSGDRRTRAAHLGDALPGRLQIRSWPQTLLSQRSRRAAAVVHLRGRTKLAR